MKKSNKILAALFIFPFIAITLVGFSMYSIVKNGKYLTEEEYNKETKSTQITPSFTGIDLLQYRGKVVNITRSDSFAVVTDNWNKDNVSFVVKDNVLIIKSVKDDYAPVTILCPSFSSLTADSSNVYIAVALKNSTINAKSQSGISIAADADSLTLNIERDGSVSLHNSTIRKLSLHMHNGAELKTDEANILQFGNLLIEDSATVNLGGKAMKALLDHTTKE